MCLNRGKDRIKPRSQGAVPSGRGAEKWVWIAQAQGWKGHSGMRTQCGSWPKVKRRHITLRFLWHGGVAKKSWLQPKRNRGPMRGFGQVWQCCRKKHTVAGWSRGGLEEARMQAIQWWSELEWWECICRKIRRFKKYGYWINRMWPLAGCGCEAVTEDGSKFQAPTRGWMVTQGSGGATGGERS